MVVNSTGKAAFLTCAKHAEFAVTPLFRLLPHEVGEGDFKAVSDKLFSVLFFVPLYSHTYLLVYINFFKKKKQCFMFYEMFPLFSFSLLYCFCVCCLKDLFFYV